MPTIEVFFLPLTGGGRFCILTLPSVLPPVGAVLYVHPFAEEINRSRRMAALQARALAECGWAVLQLDLFGCGDSEGEFGQAEWSRWVDDVIEGSAWLYRRVGCTPALWGLRAGCLLAGLAAASIEPAPDLVFWHPVVLGKVALQQFLRLKTVEHLFVESPGGRIGSQLLREQLARGESLEIAGYELSSSLAFGLESAELVPPAGSVRIAWMEIGEALSPAAENRIRQFESAGHRVIARAVPGAAFWQTQEIVECPALIGATLEAISGWTR